MTEYEGLLPAKGTRNCVLFVTNMANVYHSPFEITYYNRLSHVVSICMILLNEESYCFLSPPCNGDKMTAYFIQLVLPQKTECSLQRYGFYEPTNNEPGTLTSTEERGVL